MAIKEVLQGGLLHSPELEAEAQVAADQRVKICHPALLGHSLDLAPGHVDGYCEPFTHVMQLAFERLQLQSLA